MILSTITSPQFDPSIGIETHLMLLQLELQSVLLGQGLLLCLAVLCSTFFFHIHLLNNLF